MTKQDWNGPIYCQDSKNKTECKKLFNYYCTDKGANKACAYNKKHSDKVKCFKNFQKLCYSNVHVYQKSNGDVYCKNSSDSKCLNDFKDICVKNAKKYCDNTKHKSICIHKLQRVCFGDAGKKTDQAWQSSSSQDTQINKYCKGADNKDKCLGTFRKICNNSAYFCQFMKSKALKDICITNFKNVCKHDSSSQSYDTYSDSSTQSSSTGTGKTWKGPFYSQKTDTRVTAPTLGSYHGKIDKAHVWYEMVRHFSAGSYCKHLKDGDKNKKCLARFARVCAQRASHCKKVADKDRCVKAFADMCFNIKDKDTYEEVQKVLKSTIKKLTHNDSETQSSYSDSSYDSDSQTSDDSSYDSSY